MGFPRFDSACTHHISSIGACRYGVVYFSDGSGLRAVTVMPTIIKRKGKVGEKEKPGLVLPFGYKLSIGSLYGFDQRVQSPTLPSGARPNGGVDAEWMRKICGLTLAPDCLHTLGAGCQRVQAAAGVEEVSDRLSPIKQAIKHFEDLEMRYQGLQAAQPA
ncbi:hypothetical protein CC86DRAFT_400657 [Ophiobolus disseminans]|uniref:Uncharacterized protein n=1 Tax=Ophiobolus disseminans TaxID=1469910 RepID=A0A6A7AFH2_9PLEO|nr:hypothetical protein CC86DRAFT_400657 [Ophiobolus disseminans]